MTDDEFFESLEPRFRKPERYEFGEYHPDGHRVRYGFLRAENECALAIYTGGLGQFLEKDFESARSLADLGITTFFLERFAEGNSERPYSGEDRQKPAAVPTVDYARHLLEFADLVVDGSSAAPGVDGQPRKPLVLIGNCYGGLVGLHACRMNPSRFDHVILTAPMLGLKWIGGRESAWVSQVSPQTERMYVGRARDWDWPLAEKLMASDVTSHDPLRNRLEHLWYRQYPDYRLGGFTYGIVGAGSLGVVQLFEEGELEKVTTPITLISAECDMVNDTSRHERAVRRLPSVKHVTIRGARHRLWRESDEYRDRLLAIIDSVVAGMCGKEKSKRQT